MANPIKSVSRTHNEDYFDVLRLFAASAVLLSHQFAIFGETEPTVLGTTLGLCGVYVFFVVSGFLVLQSWDRDPNLLRFFARRGLRLFPGLAVVVLLSVFVLGPLVTRDGAYFSSRVTWEYLLNIALIEKFILPGVFDANQLSAVNGSLWSLQPEAIMYCLLAISGTLFMRTGILAGICFAAALLAAMLPTSSHAHKLLALGSYFTAGMVFWRWRTVLLTTKSIAAFATFGGVCALLGYSTLALWALIPVIALSFALRRPPFDTSRILFGDWSYGVYLYAFPVQQSVATVVVDFGAALGISSALTLLLAMLSWRLVEKPSLKLKPGSRELAGVQYSHG